MGDLRQLCSSLNISFIGAPYDLVSLEELCDLDADFIQIEHGLLTHNELLSAAAKTGKHIFLVASRCTDDEIQNALNLVDSNEQVADQVAESPIVAPAPVANPVTDETQ